MGGDEFQALHDGQREGFSGIHSRLNELERHVGNAYRKADDAARYASAVRRLAWLIVALTLISIYF
jgi:hypothetical protein